MTARRCTRCGRLATNGTLCMPCERSHLTPQARATREHVDALTALDALGVAVATVARATLTVFACAGIPQYVGGHLRLRWNGYDERHEIVRTDDFLRDGEPRILWRSEPSPHGPAWTGAEAVARLIELVEERTR